MFLSKGNVDHDIIKQLYSIVTHLFPDVHELAEQKQKQLLEKYIALYRNHRSLPRITDTYHMVANFCFPTLFEPQLKRLMVVLYRTDPAQFCEVISQAAFQLLLFYKSEPSVKVRNDLKSETVV